MTKTALRRQERERQALEASQTPQSSQEGPNSAETQTQIPTMEAPPPYDAPYRPTQRAERHGTASSPEHDGCMNVGPGKASGCLNINTGSHGQYLSPPPTY